MGLSCAASNCLNSYLCNKTYFQGNKIFKKINYKLEIKNEKINRDEEVALRDCQNNFKEIEKQRQEIEDKFRSFLFNTGACVLTQPTLERGLITYVIFFITQILICAKDKKEQFNKEDFSLSKFISFSKDKPYKIDHDILNNLKNKYNFDFNNVDSLIKGKDSIIEFLSTVTKTEIIIKNQIDTITKIKKEILINDNIIQIIINFLDSLGFLWDFFKEILDGIIEVQRQLTDNKKYELFFSIANKAAEKKISDPKYIALLYSNGDNCGDVKKWEENMTYKEIIPTKY